MHESELESKNIFILFRVKRVQHRTANSGFSALQAEESQDICTAYHFDLVCNYFNYA